MPSHLEGEATGRETGWRQGEEEVEARWRGRRSGGGWRRAGWLAEPGKGQLH